MFVPKNIVRENKHYIRHQQQDWSNEKEFGKKFSILKTHRRREKEERPKKNKAAYVKFKIVLKQQILRLWGSTGNLSNSKDRKYIQRNNRNFPSTQVHKV